MNNAAADVLALVIALSLLPTAGWLTRLHDGRHGRRAWLFVYIGIAALVIARLMRP
jgi:hypothetical protein